MNVIPKFQRGGGFDSFFTEYKAIQTEAPRRSQQREPRGQGSSRGSDEEKGKLTEKDLFNMIKDIDGLPNEMRALVSNLMNTFQMSSVTGIDVNNLATTYLQNLYQLKIAQQNKKNYDDALKNAQQNGAMQEPAISPDGKLVVQTEDGKVHTVGLDTYFNNRDKYSPLTVSNVAYLRRNDPSFNNDQKSFDIINNSMGFESFQKLVETAKANLGTTEYTRNGYFSAEGQASKGLALLKTLQQNDQVQAMGSVTAEGLYEYKIIDKDQLSQIKALTSYISTLFPDRAKTWAAWKLQTPDKNKATQDLILQYLISGQTTSHSFDIQYHGTMDHAMGKGKEKSGTSKEEDPKEGFWRQAQSGKGGDDAPFSIMPGGKAVMSTDGKFYGATPGPDHNCSLGDYLTQSGVGYMVKNPKAITFGDVKLSTDSFNDVMVNVSSGAYVITLPTKGGVVWLEAVETFSDFNDELKKSGLQPGSTEYQRKAQELLKQSKYAMLAPIMNSNGVLKPDNSGQFLVLEGLTSSKAAGISDRTGKKWGFDDIRSKYIVNAGDDDELYRVLESGLSNKDRGDYKLDSNVVWWNNDKLYKGNIYIQLTTNPINSMNADGNEIKESTAHKYEEAQQIWNKRNTQGSVDSNILIQ